MIDALAWAVLAAGLLLAVWTGIQYARNRPTDDAIMIAAIVVEAALLVQSVIGLIRLGDAHLVEPVTFVAYAIGVLIPIPVGFQLARIERTKFGSAVLGFTSLVAAVMILRLLALWRNR